MKTPRCTTTPPFNGVAPGGLHVACLYQPDGPAANESRKEALLDSLDRLLQHAQPCFIGADFNESPASVQPDPVMQRQRHVQHAGHDT
eukprot:3296397-Amphidinium_carterae.1